jgi:DNA-binding CsgD family transcriptional regulator
VSLFRNSGGTPHDATVGELTARVHRVSGLDGKAPRDVFLTANQDAIVQGMVRGENTPEIARVKKRSVDTVRKTVRAIYTRFGVSGATELRAALARGAFRIRVTDNGGREHNLQSGLKALRDALATLRARNLRRGTKRRRAHVSLHEHELNAIVASCTGPYCDAEPPTE